jgi:hypothetical protein
MTTLTPNPIATVRPTGHPAHHQPSFWEKSMPHAVSIRTRTCLAVLLSLACALTARAQTYSPELASPPRIGPAKADASNLASPVPMQTVIPSDGSIQAASPQATVTVNPIGFRTAQYVADGTTVNYNGSLSQYGAYIIVQGDFDHKNGLDSVTVQGDGTMNVLLNDGKGNLIPSANYPSTLATYSSAVQGFAVDVNGDGFLDVVASISTPSKGFMVWINNGDGTFAPRVTYKLPTVTDPGSYILGGMTVGDVNKDGIQDVVVLAYVTSPGGLPLSPLYAFTFLGKGDGTFASTSIVTNKTSLLTPSGALSFSSATLADMNGDGKLDLVSAIVYKLASTGVTYQYMAVSLGDGTGHFAAFPADTANVELVANSTLHMQIEAVDLNNDGKLDILWSDAVDSVYGSLGNGDGTLQPPSAIIVSGAGATAFTTGDFNRDGIADIAVYTNGLTAIYTGLGNGSFSASPVAQYPSELVANQPTVAQDVNGDGILDLVVQRPFFNILQVLKGNGDGTFQSETPILPSNTGAGGPNGLEPADNITVLSAGNWYGGTSTGFLAEEDISGTFYVDLTSSDGHGGLTFTRALSAQRVSAYGIYSVEPIAADFNGDGRQDAVFTTSHGIAIGLSQGDGTFSNVVETVFPKSFLCGLGFADAADLNGDGHLDLVIAYSGDKTCNYTNPVLPSGFFVLLGDGTGNFTTTFQAAGQELYRVKIAALKKDGVPDLIFDDLGPITPAIYSIAPTSPGVYPGTTTTLWQPGSQLADMLVQDVNGDGIADLTLLQVGIPTAGPKQKGILTMLGNGDGTFQTPQFLYVGLSGVSEHYADFNQDGLPDLAVDFGAGGSFTLNGIAVFPNTGNNVFASPLALASPVSLTSAHGSTTANPLLLTGDFNADGAPDLAVVNGAGYVPGVVYLNQAGTSIQLTAGASSITQYSPVTFNVLATAVGSTQPTGSISFYANGTLLGSAPISNGYASFTTSSLPVGTDTIVAKYAGSSSNYPASSNSTVVTVAALAPDFAVTASASTLTVTSASSATATITLAANQSFTGPVTFLCQGLPAGAVCAFAPASIALTAANPATTTVTLSYSNQGANATSRLGTEAAAALCATFFLFCLVPGKRRRLRASLLTLLIAAGAMAGLSGCSGSSAPKPAIAANVTILATGVSGTTTVAHSVPLQVTIQP